MAEFAVPSHIAYRLSASRRPNPSWRIGVGASAQWRTHDRRTVCSTRVVRAVACFATPVASKAAWAFASRCFSNFHRTLTNNAGRRVNSSCAFCARPLGRNVVLTSLPVGTHVVFDAKRSRAWVACSRCERWNLVDPEQITSVIDECKTVFSMAPHRDVDSGIGRARSGSLDITYLNCDDYSQSLLARHMARVGRRAIQTNAMAAVVVGSSLLTIQAGVAAVGGAVGAALGAALFFGAAIAIRTAQRRRSLAIRLASDGKLTVSRAEAFRARINVVGANWSLQLPTGRVSLELRGQDAFTAMALIIPLIRPMPSSPAIVAASQQLAMIQDPDDYIRGLASGQHTDDRGFSAWWNFGQTRGTMAALRPDQLLCLEMISTESHERHILAGENQRMQRQWTEATVIADIVDDLDGVTGNR